MRHFSWYSTLLRVQAAVGWQGDLALGLTVMLSAGGGVASYIPGTEANRISRAEQDSSTGSNTAAGLASYIPGTQANQESKAAAGQDISTHTSGGGLLGGLMSYIPGTEANRESRAATGQDSTTHDTGSASAQGGEVSYSDQQVSSVRGGESDSQQAFKPFSIVGADADTWSYHKVTNPQQYLGVLGFSLQPLLLSDPVTQHVQ